MTTPSDGLTHLKEFSPPPWFSSCGWLEKLLESLSELVLCHAGVGAAFRRVGGAFFYGKMEFHGVVRSPQAAYCMGFYAPHKRPIAWGSTLPTSVIRPPLLHLRAIALGSATTSVTTLPPTGRANGPKWWRACPLRCQSEQGGLGRVELSWQGVGLSPSDTPRSVERLGCAW